MAEVPTAAAAVDLGPGAEDAAIIAGGDGVRQRVPERRPAGAAVEFRVRGKGCEVATGTVVVAFALFQAQILHGTAHHHNLLSK